MSDYEWVIVLIQIAKLLLDLFKALSEDKRDKDEDK